MISGKSQRRGRGAASRRSTICAACRPMSSKLGMRPPTTPVPMNVLERAVHGRLGDSGAISRRRVARVEQPAVAVLVVAGREHHDRRRRARRGALAAPRSAGPPEIRPARRRRREAPRAVSALPTHDPVRRARYDHAAVACRGCQRSACSIVPAMSYSIGTPTMSAGSAGMACRYALQDRRVDHRNASETAAAMAQHEVERVVRSRRRSHPDGASRTFRADSGMTVRS